jgi:NADPH-dependent 2,4-dienoyl-CoA reductase/sulfur reductase-like enzyme
MQQPLHRFGYMRFMKFLALALFSLPAFAAEHADIVVYGGTPSGVMAAVAAARHGHSVALIDINAHVGGVVSGGLTGTDIGDRRTVGGLAAEFFKRASGNTKLAVDQRKETTPFNFVPLGEFTFRAGDSGFVQLTNAGVDGNIVVDAVRWVWLGE